MIRKLLILLLLACPSLALATVYTPTAFRIDGTTTQSPSACQTAGACNGWVLEIDTPTIAAGGTYNFGLGTNNAIANARVIVTVTHSGYQSGINGGTCGTSTTYSQTLYGTHVLREPYNNAATNDDQVNGSTLTQRIALSSTSGPALIFSGETVTVQIVSSYYTAGGNTIGTVAAGTAVTNNSTLAYSTARAIFNWTYPGWQHVTGSTDTVRGMGFSQFTMYGRPIACVVYTVSDAHSHSNTYTVNTPTVDPTMGDKAAVVEYIGYPSVSGFTQGDKLTINFKAYPWVGDSTSVMDSSDGTYPQPDPRYSPQYGMIDSTGAGRAASYVDASINVPGSHTSGTFQAGEIVTQQTSSAKARLIDVTGANGSGPLHIGAIYSGTIVGTTGKTWTGGTSGAVFTQTVFTVTTNINTTASAGLDSHSCAGAESGGQPGSACATINGALVKMAAYNNASSTPTHNDASGTMYMATGYYNWTGAAVTTGSSVTANSWADLVPASGATKASVIIQGYVSSPGFGTNCAVGSLTTCGTPLHLKGITINNRDTAPVSIFSAQTFLWFDNVSIAFNASGTAPIYQVTDTYFTNGVSFADNLAGNGLCPFSAGFSYPLVRGADLANIQNVCAYTMVGNTHSVDGDMQIISASEDLAGNPPDVMPMVAFNTFYHLQANGLTNLSFGLSLNTAIGYAFVQNVWENTYNGDTQPMWLFSGDNGSATPVNNVMSWNNTLVGGRINRAYNETGTTTYLRQAWAEVGNILDFNAIKSDTFGTPSAARVGNWYELYGSGNRSDAYLDSSFTTDAGQFCNEFWGLNSYGGTITGGGTQPPTCSTNAYTVAAFKNRQSYIGSGAGAGGGDYHLKSNSVAVNLFASMSQTLPYDISGQLRNNSGWGSAGAYEQAIVMTPVFGW